ncbi:hypothetical protein CEXT_81621 [Caerostris extrusa]|uniref:Uncharacterized protein n=1 Tax=Caerostris extrusa TaxID=172846 RepID=A0AAV4MZ12_CAEEX|nr:hypothetical protein CEXT_81621 [Caerostris extrusa]
MFFIHVPLSRGTAKELVDIGDIGQIRMGQKRQGDHFYHPPHPPFLLMPLLLLPPLYTYPKRYYFCTSCFLADLGTKTHPMTNKKVEGKEGIKKKKKKNWSGFRRGRGTGGIRKETRGRFLEERFPKCGKKVP